MNKKRMFILLIINVYLFLSTLIITIMGVINGAGEGQLGEQIIKWGYFKPFTMDSNIFMGIYALIFSIYLILMLLNKKKNISLRFEIIYFSAVTSVSLTIMTVICFLTPGVAISYGPNSILNLYKDDMFFFHVLNPILSMVSFILFNNKNKIKIKHNFISMIPMLIYSVVYVLNVVVFKTWSDFYGFTFGGKYQFLPLIFLAMISFTFLISFLLGFVRNKVNKQN